MADAETDIAHWEDYYRTHSFAAESSFARFVNGYFARPLTIVEMGCGDGRDAAYFHRVGHTVIAVDRAAAGIASAQKKIVGSGGAALQFYIGDAGDEERLSRIFNDELIVPASSDVVLYLRFFLHAIPEDTQETLLRTAARNLPNGFYLAAEFRTDKDAALPKAEGLHYRRFIAPADFAARLEALGFQIKHQEARFGLSPYRDEDPHLCRIVARGG